MDSNHQTRIMLIYSTLDQALRHLKNARTLNRIMLFLPVPLIAGAVRGFFYFQPTWYLDPFLCAILALFVFGQLGALVQLLELKSGNLKAAKTIEIIRRGGDRPNLAKLQEEMMNKAPSCHVRDNILRWIQLGIQGETSGIERMMEHAGVRRDQSASKLLSFHTIINRTTLKMGFLGTLIGLMMTFEPMKQAMLSLQGSMGEFKFIQDIVKAIDGNAYAIMTTLFATGLSVFIELLTIQIFERILGQFEMLNNNVDDWCLIHLQPWIKENYGEKKNMNAAIELQEQFARKLALVQNAMDEQLRALAAQVKETTRQITAIAPLQQEMGEKVRLLADYEHQYRRFLASTFKGLAPGGPPPATAADRGGGV